MAAEKSTITRENSRFRRGCEHAVQGQKSIVALETWATVGEGAALGKLDRTIGEAGDLNPTWGLIENILRVNPVPVLNALAEICGVRWERVPENPAVVLQAIIESQGELHQRVADLSISIARLCDRELSICEETPCKPLAELRHRTG